MCILFLCSDDPVEGDPFGHFQQTFKVSMMDACCAEPAACLCNCVCMPCVQYGLRYKVLKGNMDDYMCCQGYVCADGGCCKPGEMGEKSCPELCLCCEVCCCPGFALTASRSTVMDRYQLTSDPMDRRLIRFNNFCQMLSCICDFLGIFMKEFRDLAELIRCIADIVFLTISGCATSQVVHELKDRGEWEVTAPGGQAMERGPEYHTFKDEGEK